MKYGVSLLDKAAKQCGSFYKLARTLRVHESTISAIRAGERPLPHRWVPELALLAEVDPDEAILEAAKERNSRLSGHEQEVC